MAKSVRVIVERPDTNTPLPHDVFPSVARASAAAHKAMPWHITSYINGYENTTTVIDHVVPLNSNYDANKEEILSVVPWWQNAENKAEVEEYQTANNIKVTVLEFTDPDVTGAFNCTNIDLM